MAAGIGLGLSVASGLIGSYTGYQQSKAAEANHKYNAALAANKAKQVSEDAKENTRRRRKNNEKDLASVRARLATQGTMTGQGSALETFGETATELELQVADAYRSSMMQHNALMQESYTHSARAKDAKSAGKIGLVTSLLGMGANTANKVSKYKSSGLYAQDKVTYGKYKAKAIDYKNTLKGRLR